MTLPPRRTTRSNACHETTTTATTATNIEAPIENTNIPTNVQQKRPGKRKLNKLNESTSTTNKRTQSIKTITPLPLPPSLPTSDAPVVPPSPSPPPSSPVVVVSNLISVVCGLLVARRSEVRRIFLLEDSLTLRQQLRLNGTYLFTRFARDLTHEGGLRILGPDWLESFQIRNTGYFNLTKHPPPPQATKCYVRKGGSNMWTFDVEQLRHQAEGCVACAYTRCDHLVPRPNLHHPKGVKPGQKNKVLDQANAHVKEFFRNVLLILEGTIQPIPAEWSNESSQLTPTHAQIDESIVTPPAESLADTGASSCKKRKVDSPEVPSSPVVGPSLPLMPLPSPPLMVEYPSDLLPALTDSIDIDIDAPLFETHKNQDDEESHAEVIDEENDDSGHRLILPPTHMTFVSCEREDEIDTVADGIEEYDPTTNQTHPYELMTDSDTPPPSLTQSTAATVTVTVASPNEGTTMMVTPFDSTQGTSPSAFLADTPTRTSPSNLSLASHSPHPSLLVSVGLCSPSAVDVGVGVGVSPLLFPYHLSHPSPTSPPTFLMGDSSPVRTGSNEFVPVQFTRTTKTSD